MNQFKILIIVSAVAYLGLLFLIAYIVEHNSRLRNKVKSSAFIYSLSLAIYCTAWTYFGSVGKASKTGADFLPIYLGPTLLMPLWWVVVKKIIRIVNVTKVSTIADFISLRYGVNVKLGMIVTIMCLFSIVPYISLQIKAISESFELIFHNTPSFSSLGVHSQAVPILISIIFGVFIALYGTSKFENNTHNSGLVASVAFESIVKLFAFIFAGIYVVYSFSSAPHEAHVALAALKQNLTITTIRSEYGMSEWFGLTILSAVAFLLLPRQFQVSVLENNSEDHLKTAIWQFPLYLLLINLFVIPIAWVGLSIFSTSVNPDYFILSIPIVNGDFLIGMLVFLGGFSAASAMIVLETLALSNMLSNNFIIPSILSWSTNKKELNFFSNAMRIKYVSIFIILLLSNLYYYFVSPLYTLVGIGLISFVSIAQFLPSFIGSLYWKKATKKAVIFSLCTGFVVWFYTLILPSLVAEYPAGTYWIEQGLFGLHILKPNALFGLTIFSPVIHSFFWSMVFNGAVFIVISVNSKPSAIEKQQAHLFVDVFKYSDITDSNIVWNEFAVFQDLYSMMHHFLGEKSAQNALHYFNKKYGVDINSKENVDPRVIPLVERLLSGAVGPISARILISSVTQDSEIRFNQMVDILKESQQTIELNKELKKAKDELQVINEKLKELDSIRDEFLATVTHELRTPITSIRSFAEILNEHDDIDASQREQFTNIIFKESERISRLINQVLDLEKYDTGRQKLQLKVVNIPEFIDDLVAIEQPLILKKNIDVKVEIDPRLNEAVFDRDKMLQVNLNLFNNALKFSPENSRIIIKNYVEDDKMFFEIIDQGKGIPKDLSDRIFEKFFQAKDQTIKKPEGSGLGLAISKKIIELHLGKIWVESVLDVGTKFIYYFPYLKKY